MIVLVTGGTGVVGKPAVDHLLEHGHTVRLLSRHAAEDAGQWAEGVEPFPASVSDASTLWGAADGCGAVLHIVGIVQEEPPEVTFEKVNVQGTLNLLREAERAGVSRFVYVSSLGAPRGESDYHRSKREAEAIVRGFNGNWLIVRPGNVYGPGDDVVSLLLKMVRTLPAVPIVGRGDQPFQPIWADDLGEALALAVERDDPSRTACDVAGLEVTTMSELLDRIEEITGKRPPRIPVPEVLAQTGASVMEKLGLPTPVNTDQLVMLTEENVLEPGTPNALVTVFGITPTPLEHGLAMLADELPEQLPSEGRGKLHRQRYWADIRGSRLDRRELLRMVRDEFYSIPPEGLLEVGAEPGAMGVIEEGATLTLAIPLRGNIQVRVEEITDEAITMVTLEGHPLSGAIRLMAFGEGDLLRFEVRSYTRASDLIDLIGMRTVGSAAQHVTWRAVVEEVVRRTGGEAVDGVQSQDVALEEAEAARVEEWVQEIVQRRQREENADELEEARRGNGEAGGNVQGAS